MMHIYIEKKPHHGKRQYLVNWNDPETGYCFGDWFPTLKEIYEYFEKAVKEYHRVNF